MDNSRFKFRAWDGEKMRVDVSFSFAENALHDTWEKRYYERDYKIM